MTTQETIQGILNSLSEEEREETLRILQEFADNGSSEHFKDLMYKDFEEIPVDIDTFIEDDRYLGKGLKGPDGKCSIFPYWRKVLRDVFEGGKEVRELILTGAIGLGKTRIAVVCFLYNLYQVLCTKNPNAYLGVAQNETICFSLFNVTLDLVDKVVYGVVKNLLRMSPWFNEHGSWTGNRDSSEWIPYKSVRITTGSSEQHSLGKAIFCVEGNTLIRVKDGYVPIKDMQDTGYSVMSLSPQGVKYTNRKCIQTGIANKLIRVTMEDGTQLVCTPNHRIALENGEFIEVERLKPGMNVKEIEKA